MLINKQCQIHFYQFFLNIVFEQLSLMNVIVLGLPFLVGLFTCPAYFFAKSLFFESFRFDFIVLHNVFPIGKGTNSKIQVQNAL